jgi:predicted acyltransferase (DUF342 family)
VKETILIAMVVVGALWVVNDRNSVEGTIERARFKMITECMVEGHVIVSNRLFFCAAMPNDGRPAPEAPIQPPAKKGHGA